MNLGSFGFWEMFVIAGLALLLFGPKKLPELARGLSQAVREFRRGLNQASREFQQELHAAGTEAPAEQRSTPDDAGSAARRDELTTAIPASPDEETHHR